VRDRQLLPRAATQRREDAAHEDVEYLAPNLPATRSSMEWETGFEATTLSLGSAPSDRH
jgi:hypothetical protein